MKIKGLISEELRLDEFFQRLRDIQKKERSVSGLADVGDNFYNDVYIYLNKLIKKIGDNPLSFHSYLHRDARRIAAEICERREHKIVNSALLNIQKSHNLFGENNSKNGISSPSLPPQNMTPEEEDLYYSITESFSKYRNEMGKPFDSSIIKKETSSPKTEIKPNSRDRKKAPLGIEHDIESYQSYEIPEIHDISNGAVIKKSKSSGDKKNKIKTFIVLDDIPSVMGVDREIYGPLAAEDVVAMPEANAQIIINNHKGKYIKRHEKIAYR